MRCQSGSPIPPACASKRSAGRRLPLDGANRKAASDRHQRYQGSDRRHLEFSCCAIHALDRDGALPTRLANYDAHKAFLADTSRFGVTIVMSGPLVSDDGERMIGNLVLIEAPSRFAVEAINHADPFTVAGIWGKVTRQG